MSEKTNFLVGRCPNCNKITAIAVHQTLDDVCYNARYIKEWRKTGLVVAVEEIEGPVSLKNSCNTRDCKVQP